MKIVHISSDDYSGGAAIAAYRLHSFMLKSGIASTMLVKRKVRLEDTNVSLFLNSIFFRLKSRILINTREKIVKYDILRGLFSYPIIGSDVSNHYSVKRADIIFIHWTNRDYLSVSSIKRVLKLNKPVYWVLHDMWAMTGGCHHSFDCEKYTSHCSKCPHLLKPGINDWSYRLFKRKKKVFDLYENLEIITPSIWLGNCASKSSLLSNKKIHVIPNILDLKTFKPNNLESARLLFNLPGEGEIVLFGAIEGTENPYKGWSYLQKALQILSKSRSCLYILIFGSDPDQSVIDSVPFPVYFSGILHDNESISMLYNAADVFVASSLADNLPNTIVESLACGTPVVGFNVGGIPDLINHKENGYLANYKDSDDLAYGISWVLDNKTKLRIPARGKIEKIMKQAQHNSLGTIGMNY